MPDVVNRMVKLAQCRPHPRNYNQHSTAQLEDLRSSLRRFGQVRSIVVQAAADGGYLLVAGHGIVAAASLELYTELRADVIPATWSEMQVLAYLAADNELGRQSNPDIAQLAAVVANVQAAADAELARLAAGSEARLQELLALATPPLVEAGDAPVDRAAELQAAWGVQVGDMWQLGRHYVACGDCTDKAVVARVMRGEQAILVITDPPYGVSYADKNEFLNELDKGNCVQTPIQNDHQSKEETQALWKAAFEQMENVMKPGACVYCFMPQGGDQMMMMMMMMKAGIEPRHELIWLKNNHVLGRVDYAYKHEPILYAWKAGGHKFYGGFKTSILEFDRPHKSEFHPTMKPIQLICELVTNSSLDGDVIYDPFLGSGTTLIACEQLGRQCRGIELDPRYVAVTLQRFQEVTGITPTRVEG